GQICRRLCAGLVSSPGSRPGWWRAGHGAAWLRGAMEPADRAMPGQRSSVPAAEQAFLKICAIFRPLMNHYHPEIRAVNVTRYVTPLREGGSMPAIAEADDGFLYVLKFRGAGQGEKALIAELIGGEIARALGFKVPEIVFASLDSAFGRTEPDEEIQDLLKAS